MATGANSDTLTPVIYSEEDKDQMLRELGRMQERGSGSSATARIIGDAMRGWDALGISD